MKILLILLAFFSLSAHAETDHLSEIKVRIAESGGKGVPDKWVEFSGVLALGQSMLCFPATPGVQKNQGKYRDCAVSFFKGEVADPFFGFRVVVKLSSPKNVYLRIERDAVQPVIVVTDNETQMSDEIVQEKYRIQTERIGL